MSPTPGYVMRWAPAFKSLIVVHNTCTWPDHQTTYKYVIACGGRLMGGLNPQDSQLCSWSVCGRDCPVSWCSTLLLLLCVLGTLCTHPVTPLASAHSGITPSTGLGQCIQSTAAVRSSGSRASYSLCPAVILLYTTSELCSSHTHRALKLAV